MAAIQRTKYQTHPYHLVDQSPWPILTSLALMSLTVSIVLYMHGFISGGLLFSLGLFLTAGAMTLWFRDIIAEGTFLGHHTFDPFFTLFQIIKILKVFKLYY